MYVYATASFYEIIVPNKYLFHLGSRRNDFARAWTTITVISAAPVQVARLSSDTAKMNYFT